MARVLYHIVNPVVETPNRSLQVAQPITYESYKRAKIFSSEIEIKLCQVGFENDLIEYKNVFDISEGIYKSVLNYGSFVKRKKLPLLKDILINGVKKANDEDYIIYSNADIAIQPFFYEFIDRQIKSGRDCFIINRRTISNSIINLEDISLMYASIGLKHPGYDCFVFPKKYLIQFIWCNACIGASWVGKSLFVNLKLLAHDFAVFENEHLTFHLGDDKIWESESFDEYKIFNGLELIKQLDQVLMKKDLKRNLKREFSALKAGISMELNRNVTKGRKNVFRFVRK